MNGDKRNKFTVEKCCLDLSGKNQNLGLNPANMQLPLKKKYLEVLFITQGKTCEMKASEKHAKKPRVVKSSLSRGAEV